jgi:hypothetical protein
MKKGIKTVIMELLFSARLLDREEESREEERRKNKTNPPPPPQSFPHSVRRQPRYNDM